MKLSNGLLFSSLLATTYSVFADPTVINNYNNTVPQQRSESPSYPLGSSGGNGSEASSPDPRVPPPGVYTTQTGRDSSQTTYTTGETKTYIVDPNTNNNIVNPIIQPYINGIAPEPRR